MFIVWDMGSGAGVEWTEMMNEAVNGLVDELAGTDSKVPVEFCFIGYGEKPHVKKKMSALTGREFVNFEPEGQSNLKPALEQVAAFAGDASTIPPDAFAPVAVLLGGKASDVSSGGRNISDIANDAGFKDARDALGPKAVRLAAGYGAGSDFDLLNAFIDDPSMPAAAIDGAASLARFMDWVAKLIRDKASSDDPDSVSPEKPEGIFDKKCLMFRRADKDVPTDVPINPPAPVVTPHAAAQRCLPVFVLIDISYSMENDMDTLNDALNSLISVIRNVGGDVRLCIITFGTNVVVRKPLSPVTANDIYELEADGLTYMGKGLNKLYREMSKIPEGSYDAMAILLSDGHPNDYEGKDLTIGAIRSWNPMKTIVGGEHSRNALRASMAIGTTMDNAFLLAFNSDGTPVVQSTPDAIRKFFKKIGEIIEEKMNEGDANSVKTIDFSTEFSVKELVFKR